MGGILRHTGIRPSSNRGTLGRASVWASGPEAHIAHAAPKRARHCRASPMPIPRGTGSSEPGAAPRATLTPSNCSSSNPRVTRTRSVSLATRVRTRPSDIPLCYLVSLVLTEFPSAHRPARPNLKSAVSNLQSRRIEPHLNRARVRGTLRRGPQWDPSPKSLFRPRDLPTSNILHTKRLPGSPTTRLADYQTTKLPRLSRISPARIGAHRDPGRHAATAF